MSCSCAVVRKKKYNRDTAGFLGLSGGSLLAWLGLKHGHNKAIVLTLSRKILLR